jgi:hypothetical protein
VAPAHSQSVLAVVCDRMEAEHAAHTAACPQRWTTVFIIASARPLAGKTFLARLLTDYLRLDAKPVEAFDLNSEPVLAEALPALTTAGHLETTKAQMSLFDRLIMADGVPKVVDLGHVLFTRFFGVMEEIRFVEQARRRSIETVVLYAADPHAISAKAYEVLQRRFPAAITVPVFNDAILKGRKVRDAYPFGSAAAVPLQISALSPGLKTHSERLRLSFADFHGTLPVEVPLNQACELRSWTKRAFLEFRELELRLLLDKLRASLK